MYNFSGCLGGTLLGPGEHGEPMGKWLSTLGLVFGIVGVILLFFWAPPQPSFERGASIGLEDNTTLPSGKTVAQSNVEIAANEARYRRISRIGLVLIGLSFAFQLAGVWL